MGHWRAQTEEWLSREQRGQDEAAERAFTEVFAAFPEVEPSQNFVRMATGRAWRATRHRYRLAVVSAVAAVTFAASGSIAAYTIWKSGESWPVVAAASTLPAAVSVLVTTLTTLVGWLTAAMHIGDLVAGIATSPGNLIGILCVGLISAAALYGLLRLLRTEFAPRMPGALCLLP